MEAADARLRSRDRDRELLTVRRTLAVLSLLFVAAVARGQVEEIVDVVYEINNPPAAATTHSILSTTHSDTVVSTPNTNDVLAWNGTAWAAAALGGGAPTSAHYITDRDEAGLSAEQSIGALTTGLLLNTVSGSVGTLSAYAGATCTNQFVRSLSASGAATCASVGTSDISAAAVTLAKIGNAAASSRILGSGSSGSGSSYAELSSTDFTFGSSTVNIANAAVTLAKIANAAASSKVLGSGSSGSGASYSELSLGSNLSISSTTLNTTAWCEPSPMTACVFDDFSTNVVSNGAAVSGTFFRCNASGTGAGCNSDVVSGIVDANTFGVWEATTGTTSTGAGVIAGMGQAASAAAKTGGLLISGGERIKARVYVPTASDGTNTFSTCFGFYNSGSVTDTLNICWDNNSDTHWTIQARKASTGNSVASSTTATAAAWHTLEIVVNANATSVGFFVDGAELNVSPLTSNIPTTVVTVPTALRVVSSLSANAKVADIDYAAFTKPLTR